LLLKEERVGEKKTLVLEPKKKLRATRTCGAEGGRSRGTTREFTEKKGKVKSLVARNDQRRGKRYGGTFGKRLE